MFHGKNSQNNKKFRVHDNNFPPENELADGLRNSLVRVLSSWQLKNHTNSSIVPPHNTLYFLCRHCTMEVL